MALALSNSDLAGAVTAAAELGRGGGAGTNMPTGDGEGFLNLLRLRSKALCEELADKYYRVYRPTIAEAEWEYFQCGTFRWGHIDGGLR